MKRDSDAAEQWRNILDTNVLKGNVNLIAMYITIYELLEDTIITRPKDFYTVIEFDESVQKRYKENVLSLYKKDAIQNINTRNKELIVSLIWFKNFKAVDENDIQVCADSRTLRNKVTHEMSRKLVKRLVFQ